MMMSWIILCVLIAFSDGMNLPTPPRILMDFDYRNADNQVLVHYFL